MTPQPDDLPDDIETLKAMLLAERQAHRNEAREQELRIEKLKLTIAKLRHERFGQSAERGALLEQLELQLFQLEEDQAESEQAASDAAQAAEVATGETIKVEPFQRRKPARRPLPAHLPRERVVHPSPSACPCCGGTLHKLGEDVTETLELVPRQWKVIQHVREKFSCRSCEKIAQPPAPSHPIARGRAGPGLLAHVLFGKYGLHLPLTRQSATYAREGIDLDVSTLADWVGASAATLMPLIEAIRSHVFEAQRIHADETTVPVLDIGKTRTGRLWTYVRDDRPFAGADPPAAAYFYSPDRGGVHPEGHLASYAGLMQADAYAGFNRLYQDGRKPGPIVEAACWAHARRKFFDAGGVISALWRGLPRRRSPSRPSPASTRCSPSSARSMGCRPPSAGACVRNAAGRGSRRWRYGCASNTPGSPPPARSPRPSLTASTAGTHWSAYSATIWVRPARQSG